MFSVLRFWISGAPRTQATRRHRRVVARYDAAQTSDNNRRHWAMADGLSARATNSPEVRWTLRSRSRYEVANNSYAKGVILALANDVIGTGTRLQMGGLGAEDCRLIEREFGTWARAVGIAEKRRTMRMARAQDGETFAILVAYCAEIHLGDSRWFPAQLAPRHLIPNPRIHHIDAT